MGSPENPGRFSLLLPVRANPRETRRSARPPAPGRANRSRESRRGAPSPLAGPRLVKRATREAAGQYWERPAPRGDLPEGKAHAAGPPRPAAWAGFRRCDRGVRDRSAVLPVGAQGVAVDLTLGILSVAGGVVPSIGLRRGAEDEW